MTLFPCALCGGDGRETCDNPDHGALYSLYNDAHGCPCCGHSPDHKVKNGGPCEICDGVGMVPFRLVRDYLASPILIETYLDYHDLDLDLLAQLSIESRPEPRR
jgi:hypothetical protein